MTLDFLPFLLAHPNFLTWAWEVMKLPYRSVTSVLTSVTSRITTRRALRDGDTNQKKKLFKREKFSPLLLQTRWETLPEDYFCVTHLSESKWITQGRSRCSPASNTALWRLMNLGCLSVWNIFINIVWLHTLTHFSKTSVSLHQHTQLFLSWFYVASSHSFIITQHVQLFRVSAELLQ